MTIKDVAALAGVSPAAVSRYLNGGSLSEEKREKIQATIEQTGYRPTAAAQLLRSGQQKQIGILVPKIYSDSVALIMEGITEIVQKAGYVGVMGDTHGDEQKELEFISLMEANQAAGVIIMGTTVTARRVDAYKASRMPIVITGQNVAGMPCIYHDDYHASKELTRRTQKAKDAIQVLKSRKAELQDGLGGQRGWLAQFRNYGNIESLTRAVAVTFIDRILLFPDKEIRIVLRNQDQIRHVVGFLRSRNPQASDQWEDLLR